MHTLDDDAAALPALGSPKLQPDAATLDALAELASIDCQIYEIAAHFRVPVAVLKDFLSDAPEARAAIKRGYEEGTARLSQVCATHERAKPAKRQNERSHNLRTAG